MEHTCTPPEASISVSDAAYRYVDLPAMFGSALTRLPVVLRLLLENVIRNTQGEERQRAVNGVLRWLETGTSQEEIAFQPNRVLMHDTTSTPVLVDIAAMRDALAEAGADPAALNPVLPVDVSVDHSLAVEAYAQPDAAARNLQIEMRRNAERYRFLRWASNTLRGVRIHPPGTGIMHNPQPGAAGHGGHRADHRRCSVAGARYPDRHRQPHADDQRHRRAGLGGGRAGGADGDVRHAGHAAHSGCDWRAPGRCAAGRFVGHGSGVDVDQGAARHRRVGRVCGVLRPRCCHAHGRRAFRRRQHGARVWRDHRLLPRGCADVGVPARNRSYGTRHRTGGGAAPPCRPVVRPRQHAALYPRDRDRLEHRAPARGGAASAAGSAALYGDGACVVRCRCACAARQDAPHASRRHCRDHELHQYVGPGTARRGRAGRAPRTRARFACVGVGEDVAGAGLARGCRVSETRRFDR
uniref:aconitate hydratase n=1 Tax=Ralstonia solanacearum TaxID=305 RepID=A0A0S4TNI0_RALSL|nr:protein of unknown function [Ralstonia solanacearum]